MKFHCLAFVLFSGIFSCGSISPALAQSQQGGGFAVDTSKLQKPNMQHYRGQLQIINAGPDIIDRRTAPAGPNNVVINLQPMAPSAGTTQVVSVGSPAGVLPNTAAAAPGQMVIDMNRPPSGFQSNMNSLRAPAGLPIGHSTNRLGNTAQANVQGKLQTPARQPQPQVVANNANPAIAAGYKKYDTNPAVGAGGQFRTETRTSARLLRSMKAQK